ncbi:MAG: DUF4910 domain-containing protein [Parvularculaceae bacterium]
MPKRLAAALLGAAIAVSSTARAELREFISEAEIAALAEETSGEAAKRNLDRLTTYHRMRASGEFRQATEYIRDKLKSYGLSDARILEYPADGKTMFGTQKSRPAWNVEFAELWRLEQDGGGEWVPAEKLADWDAVPLSLAQDSLSGEATAGLVDIGAGTSDADYDGKTVRGQYVLTSSQPEAVAEKAVGELGAAGIISYAPNQKTAWWKEDERLLRWGHLDSFPKVKTHAFMITLGDARRLQARLAKGEAMRFHGKVVAAHDKTGHYSFATATIPGADKSLRKEEILFTCHLDHPRPGANDNVSGCASILEAARTAQTLIDEGRIARPKRTLRFLWPAEIEGSLIYLNANSANAARTKANLHLDMVGGGDVTKSVFRISGGPDSLPNFIGDLGFEIGAFVNAQSDIHASGAETDYPLTAPEGDRRSQLALMETISLGSDHEIYNEGSWRIPGLYLHDWPDRYIHTNYDLAANIDPTKLKRAAFIALTAGLYLADMDDGDTSKMLTLLKRNALARSQVLEEKLAHASAADRPAIARIHWRIEHDKIDSIARFATMDGAQKKAAHDFIDALAALTAHETGDDNKTGPVYARNPAVKGPMSAFGYSYLEDKLGDAGGDLALANYETRGVHGENLGEEFAYEALNLVNGERTTGEIRDYLTATLAPVPQQAVDDYLAALEKIGVVLRK